MSERPPGEIRAYAPDGLGEIGPATDLVGEIAAHADLSDGDVVVVSSKAVSKAEGRVFDGTREEWLDAETVREVARRGPTRIVESRLGLVQAAAGIDASNVPVGRVALLPVDPDESARRLREGLAAQGRQVAVLVGDTAGRAWRVGQTDLCIGAAGLDVITSYAGSTDIHGNALTVTAPATADELTGLADVVAGKLAQRPVVVVRGLSALVRPPGDHGPGAKALLRPRGEDLFAFGSRAAVVAAVAGRDQDCFGYPADPAELVAALAEAGVPARSEDDRVVATPDDERGRVVVGLIGFAFGWVVSTAEPGPVLRPVTEPLRGGLPDPGTLAAPPGP